MEAPDFWDEPGEVTEPRWKELKSMKDGCSYIRKAQGTVRRYRDDD